MKDRPTLKQLMEMTQLSRATIDRALNDRPGVHPRTRSAVDAALKEWRQAAALPGRIVSQPAFAYRVRLLLQSGDAFAEELARTAASLEAEWAEAGVQAGIVNCVGASDREVASRLREAADEADGIGIICTNTPEITAVLRSCMANGKAVVTMITDVDADARHTYVGVNNRAAGQSAAFLMGRHLETRVSPSVAVVVATFSYSCHEDREIGFRLLLRQRFPHVNVVEVIKGADSGAATYEATQRCIERYGALDGVYNVAGGNEGLACALRERGLAGKTLYVTHEVNRVTEPLLRSDVIDYVLSQDLRLLLRTTVHRLKTASSQAVSAPQVLLPIETFSRYSLS
jgi:LacI family transcriptional regulator